MKGKLFPKVCETKTLWQAWGRIKRKRAVGGIDNVSIELFDKRIEHNLKDLSQSLQTGTYSPEPTKRMYIPKDKPNERRKLAIPTIKDKIVQEATRSVVEPLFDRAFADSSYAYRSGKGPQKAVSKVEQWLAQGKEWVVTGDIDDFFDSMNHNLLMKFVSERIWEKEILRLIELWLKMGIIEKGKWVDSEIGIPQGTIISPLLSNIYLHPFDKEMKNRGHTLVRYADNFIFLGKLRKEAVDALKDGERFLHRELSLCLNQDSKSIRGIHNGFVFLGFLFKDKRRIIAETKLGKVKAKIGVILRGSANLSDAVDKLNEPIVAWQRYYGNADVKDQFKFLDNLLFDELKKFLISRGVLSVIKKKGIRQDLQRLEFFSLKDPREKQNLTSLLIAATGVKKQAKVKEKKPLSSVAKQVALKRRKYEKILSEASNLIISTPGSFVGKTSRRVVVREKRRRVKELPFFRLKNILIISNGVSISSNLVRHCAGEGIPITFFDFYGRPYAQVHSPRSPLYGLSLAQSAAATNQKGVYLAKSFVEGKIKNQINLIKYYRKYKARREFQFFEVCEESINAMRSLLIKLRDISKGDSLELTTPKMLALEGQSASYYWKLIKLLLSHDVYFQGRERRGATDLVNSLLNYGYGILYSQIYQAIILAGLNPNISFLHREQVGKPTLVFDLIEEFRQPIVDKAVIGMIRKKEKLRMEATNLTQATKTKVVEAVMRRLSSRVNFRGKKLTLREIIGHQSNSMAGFLEGKGNYRPFIDKW